MSAQHQTIMLDLEAMAKGLSTVGWVKRWSGHEPITAEWFYEGE